MVPQHRVGRNALQIACRHIDGIDIAEEGIGRRLGQCLLEGGISLGALCRVITLACLGQILIHQRIGIAGVIGALIRTEYLIGMVIRVKGGTPADNTALLSAPVDPLGGDGGLDVKADGP